MSKYNGWSTYETWLVNVWGFLPDGEPVDAESLKENFLDYAESCFPELVSGHGLACDLFSAAYSAIDWQELAEKHNRGQE